MISHKYAKSNIGNFENLNIVGILLGGSIPYKYQELNKVDEANDWDGVILVKQKIDIVNLVNLYRSELCDLLNIEYEEFPGMKVPSGAIYKNFDAIRFVGWTSNRIKKGAKIVSVEYFNEILTKNHPSLFNLLSFKDVRYAEGRLNQYRISQATRLDYELLVIHDMDIYLTDPCPKHGGCSGVFGAAIDLFMTGISVYDDGSHTSKRIAEEIVCKFQRIHTASLTLERLVNVFKNYPKFLPRFRRDFEARISNYFEKSKFKDVQSPGRVDCCENLNNLQYCYWGVIPDVLVDGVDQIMQMKCYDPPKNVDSGDFQLKKVNSQSGYCDGFYWKHTPLLADELAGTKLVSRYYRFTQKPQLVDVEKKTVFYPFFDGITLNAMRLEYTTEVLKNNGNLIPNTRDIELIILMVHLQLSEDLLRAYCASAAKSVANVDVESRSSVSNIHRVYHHYLVNDARLNEFYHDGIDVQGKHLTIEELKVLKLVVNGEVYGKLGDIICKAAELLDPSKMNNQLIVCGMGDGHCGNVRVGKEKQKNSSYKYLHFGYEMAGYHSPILDFAKPFYVDVFYNILYADKVFKRNLVNVELITGEEDILKIDFSMPKSIMSKAIYGIYIRYVLLPFLKFIDHSYDLKLPGDWCSTFGHALFCCALFTRNFSSRSDLFFANLAVGVMLTSIESISDLDRIAGDLL